MRVLVQKHEAYLRKYPDRLADLSYTLNLRREPLEHRAFSVVDTAAVDESLQISTFERTGGVPAIAFVFTGQGAQWAQMGADLLESNPVFQKSIDDMDEVLRNCSHPPTWTLREELQKNAKTSRLITAEFSQPCCTAIQVALVDVLSSWGVKPASVVGHSSGEIGAAYAAGSLSKSSAIQAAYYRGLVTKQVTRKGAMAAVGLGRGAIEPLLKPGVVIACENSPSSVTLSGDAEVVQKVVSNVREAFPDAAVRELRVDCAYHSHHMREVGEEYLALLPPLPVEVPLIPFFSSVHGEKYEGKLDGKYWTTNLVEPVLFAPAVSALLKTMPSSTVLLEVGPHSALAGPIRQILQAAGPNKVEYANVLTRGQPGLQSLLTAAGRLFQVGIEVDFTRIISPGQTLVDLPLYPWRREGPFWSESRLSRDWRLRRFPKHDLLGERVAAASDSGPTWRNLLRLNEAPWLRDHKVAGDIVFPAAGYMAMAGEAVRQLVDVDDFSFSLREVSISSALVLQEGVMSEVITHLRPVHLTNSLDSLWHEFDISVLHGDRWVKHASGQVRSGVECATPAPSIEAQQRSVDAPTWYKVMQRFGLEYGTEFQGLRNITAGVLKSEAVATIANPVTPPHTSTYPMHPTTIDFALQLYSVASSMGQSRRFTRLAVPSYIGSAVIRPAGKGDILLKVAANQTPRGVVAGDAIGTSGGSTVFSLQNLRMSPLSDAAEARGEDPHAATEMVWKPDVRLVDNALLMQTTRDLQHSDELPEIERMALACAIESCLKLAARGDDTVSSPLTVKYRNWLNTALAQAHAGTYANVADCREIASMSSDARRSLIQDLFTNLSETSAKPLVAAVNHIFHAIDTLFETDGQDQKSFLEDGFLARLYDELNFVDASDFYKLASHYKPNLRILEIGAGVGGTAQSVLDTLTTLQPHRGRHYSSYTFSDNSPDLFPLAKESLAKYEAVEYKVLDISKDPIEQGFQAEGYDLIIAANVSCLGTLPSSLRITSRDAY